MTQRNVEDDITDTLVDRIESKLLAEERFIEDLEDEEYDCLVKAELDEFLDELKSELLAALDKSKDPDFKKIADELRAALK